MTFLHQLHVQQIQTNTGVYFNQDNVQSLLNSVHVFTVTEKNVGVVLSSNDGSLITSKSLQSFCCSVYFWPTVIFANLSKTLFVAVCHLPCLLPTLLVAHYGLISAGCVKCFFQAVLLKITAANAAKTQTGS